MVLPAQCVQVIVVGAGLSGLQAATNLHNAGYTYTVVEAMDRVGGKILSLPSSDNGTGIVDAGAAWINDNSQSYMYNLAKDFGFDLVKQRAEGTSIFQKDKGDISLIPYQLPFDFEPQEIFDLLLLVGKLSRYVDRSNLQNPHLGPDAKELDSMTVLQLVSKITALPTAKSAAGILTRALLGVEPDELSALYFVDYLKSGTGLWNIISDEKGGGQYLRNQQGNQQFPIRLAAKLTPGSIKLQSPVKSITQFNDHCVVETDKGDKLCAKKVISSVSTTLLPLIKFEPPLPQEKRQLIESTKLGSYSKTILIFSEPWWRRAELSGDFTSTKGPISFTRDTSTDKTNQFSITCFHVGQSGRQWSKLDPKQRQEATLAHFQKGFRAAVDHVPEPIKIIEKVWEEEPWIKGAPNPVMMPGLMTSKAGQSIRDSFGNIHFVGTETSFDWKGYMEGAVRSGVRGAQEVINSLAATNVTVSAGYISN
ncbi:hypothetical protein QQS21_000163 [Conoideocrella luteorostrata]|uniref:Amine oxidase n=1 Tax=Conoideocrella luteorostrata TaxID=1105319 RepID=A0AAJ0CZ70_9HYPO|nr:hypothetical protein QQS21_000163 [Conoideocrella luteorostrata]